jgi:hypothetical protein
MNCRDWPYVLDTCRAHRVSSLVCHALEASAPDLVPNEVRDLLKSRFQANAFRNLFLMQQLLVLIRDFRKNSLEAIPFKGPLLAITAYGNVALREFVDLDILVTKNNFHRAHKLLAEWGYRPPSGQAGGLAESLFRSQLGSEYIRDDGRVTLELHWSFLQRWLGFRPDLETVWANSRPLQIGSLPVLDLPADMSLLYLCAHGTKHRWSRLCRVVDVAEFLRARPELNWEALLALAEVTGCRRTLFIGLYLAKSCLDASLPDTVWVKIQQDKRAISLAGNHAAQMFSPGNDFPQDRPGWFRDLYYIRTKERWREKAMYLGQVASLSFLPSDKDLEWIRLPRLLHWLYPFLRPIRVAWQSIQKVATP